MSEFDYDLFVIGAGSGGVRAARIAAQYGARVAIAEEFRVGGTCVIRGCVPKKLMVYAAHSGHAVEDAAGFGWNIPKTATFDWEMFIAKKNAEIDRLNGIYIRNLETAGVEIFHERAEISAHHQVTLKQSGRILRAQKILVATGGTPFMPTEESLPGISHAVSSNEVFHLQRLPEKILIVGGGYIAVEFAGIFNGLGSEVTLVYRGEKILRGFDEDLRTHLTAAMEQAGVTIKCHANLARIEKSGDGLQVILQDGEALSCDEVLMATGRVPATSGLGLEAAGVTLKGNGAIGVDEENRTGVASIFAVGDVTDRVNLTPVAIREGHAFADREFGKQKAWVNYDTIPTAVFSQPEIGTCGLTEEQALAEYGNLDIYLSSFSPMKFSFSSREERMMLKLIVNGDDGRILGCHLFGDGVGEMIQLVGIALKMGAKKSDFDATMAVHPTSAEELVTMRTPTRKYLNGVLRTVAS